MLHNNIGQPTNNKSYPNPKRASYQQDSEKHEVFMSPAPLLKVAMPEKQLHQGND
jgi:hypothetical protein